MKGAGWGAFLVKGGPQRRPDPSASGGAGVYAWALITPPLLSTM